jgi:microcystin-dependent protein
MAQPYVGEIRMFAGTFAPYGWRICDGSLMTIDDSDYLHQLIGNTYGGDGVTNYRLPDLRGRVPLHQSDRFVVGQNGGAEHVTLSLQQLASHTHGLVGSSAAASSSLPGDSVFATSAIDAYTFASPFVPLAAPSISATGGSQPHENRQPFLTVTYIISLFGIYPSPT